MGEVDTEVVGRMKMCWLYRKVSGFWPIGFTGRDRRDGTCNKPVGV